MDFPSDAAFIEQYVQDCTIVRRGVNSDIEKCLKEGKSLIIEGLHLDPRLYHDEVKSVVASGGGIVVPFVLTLDPVDHKQFIQSSPDPRYTCERGTHAFKNLQLVQTYLIEHACSFTQIQVDIHSFQKTLDELHDVVLKRIEAAYCANIVQLHHHS
jgi:2-phosphoglycerate kinase